MLDRHRGEITADQLAPLLERAINLSRAVGTLTPSADGFYQPAPLPPEADALRFPAKVHAAADGRVFVADTGHHRILEVVPEFDFYGGRITRVIGSGEPGWEDGGLASARFRSPCGLALAGETLFVADTENHLTRAVDLAAERVITQAGTGVQTRQRTSGGPARAIPLNSPWDLLWDDGWLYIAMAGSHQIWRLQPDEQRLEVWAGSGAEELHDADLLWAGMAHPSGLTTDGTRTFFADTEASAIRWAREGERTGTLVGTGLFDFGDPGGVGDEVRLQHALAVEWWEQEDRLLVADTYNHRIKTLHPGTREVRVLAGSGESGFADGEAHDARFWEPGGLAIHPDGAHALIADTNNHALRVVELASGRVTTLPLHRSDGGSPADIRRSNRPRLVGAAEEMLI